MLYPFLSVLWESFTVGAKIKHQRASETATFQRLVTQVDQTAKKIDRLQSETVAKSLLEKNQLDAMVESNKTLGREIDYLRNTVEEEQTAIKELAKFVYEKNRLVDALVIILKDLQQGLRMTNGDQAMLAQQFNNMFEDVNGIKRDTQLIDDSLAELKTSVAKNAETNTKQFKDVLTKFAKQQTSGDAFKAWVEGELKTLMSNPPPAWDTNTDISALKVELKHTKEYISVMRDNFMNNSCECGSTMKPKMKQFEDMLKEQRKTIKDMLEDYHEFKDDYYMSENVNGTAIQKVMDTLHQAYATRDEIHTAFQQISDDMNAGQCNCNSAKTQHQQQEHGESADGSKAEGMVVDP